MTVRTLSILILVAATLSPAVVADEGTDPMTRCSAAAESGDHATAATCFRELLAGDDDNGRAWLGLGAALIHGGDYTEAVAALTRAHDLGADPALTAILLARSHAGLGAIETALGWIETSAASGGTYATLLGGATEFEDLRGDDRFEALRRRMLPCARPEHRQFDFWLGEWEVVNAARPTAPPSHNSITSEHDGCVVRESYRTPGGYTGTSINFYDRASGRWYQSWMDNQGGALRLEGGLEGESMVLVSDDGATRQRITWTPAADGSVRQLWERSADAGTWEVVFDGTYRRR